MKLEIYKEERTGERTIRLALRRSEHGIVLEVVDRWGSGKLQGDILRINNNGTMSRCKRMSSTLGLQLEEDNRIIEQDEDE